MKWLYFLAAVLPVCHGQWFPLTSKEEIPVQIQPYEAGQEVLLQCIARNIDNGEHKFDDQDRIVTIPFPKCEETKKPLSLKYGVDEDIKCTIGFTDELYHLFQLYVHEDVPLSCRLPMSSEANYLEKGGAWILLTFNFRGEVHDSHVDLDSSLNVVVVVPSGRSELSTFVSAVGWSSGTDTQRVTIGNHVTLTMAVRWLKLLVPVAEESYEDPLPFANGFYKLLSMVSTTVLYTDIAIAVVATSVVLGVLGYRFRRARRVGDPELMVDQKND